LSDLDGDGVLDLAVLEDSGPKLFVNDISGFLSLETTKSVAQSKAIEVVDELMNTETEVIPSTDIITYGTIEIQ